VVIIGEHHEDFTAHEEGRLAVRQPLARLGQGQADPPHPLQLIDLHHVASPLSSGDQRQGRMPIVRYRCVASADVLS
jgi:hypothetical protein